MPTETRANLAVVSVGIHDFLVRGTSPCSHDVRWNGDVRGFRAKCIFLASSWYLVPFAYSCSFCPVRHCCATSPNVHPADALTCASPSSHHSLIAGMERSA